MIICTNGENRLKSSKNMEEDLTLSSSEKFASLMVWISCASGFSSNGSFTCASADLQICERNPFIISQLAYAAWLVARWLHNNILCSQQRSCVFLGLYRSHWISCGMEFVCTLIKCQQMLYAITRKIIYETWHERFYSVCILHKNTWQ